MGNYPALTRCELAIPLAANPAAPAVGSIVAYLGLRSYRFIGVAWLMHSAWDLAGVVVRLFASSMPSSPRGSLRAPRP